MLALPFPAKHSFNGTPFGGSRSLNEAGVQYLVAGGLAVNAYGYERLTNDIDLVVGLEPANLRNGIQALLQMGYRFSVPVTMDQVMDAACRRRWKEERNMVVLQMWSPEHARTLVDIFTTEPFDFDAEYKRAQQTELMAGLWIPVLQYDSLIEMKKFAGRPRDLEDVENLRKLDDHRGKS